jgi:predicted amidohydrolase
VRALLTALCCKKGATDANLARHLASLDDGAAAGARIVVFPEMSLTGSVDPDRWPGRAIARDDAAVLTLAAATARAGVAALFGVAEACGDAIFITQVLADHGRVVGHYRKRRLVDEDAYRAGAGSARFALDGAPVGIAICAEAETDVAFDDAARAGAPVVFVCAAPGLYGRRTDEAGWRAGYEWWAGSVLMDAARHARRHGLWVAISTQAGATADEDFPGLAALVDPTGAVIARTPDWHEATLVAEIPD